MSLFHQVRAQELGEKPLLKKKWKRGLGAAILAAWACLTGCGDTPDPFATYADGIEVDLTGVVHFPSTAEGDFRPGRLVAQLGAAAGEGPIANLVGGLIPDATVTFQTGDLSQFLIDLPKGVSMTQAAAALQPSGVITQVAPELLPGASSMITLRTTGTGGFTYEAATIAGLVSEDRDALAEIDKQWVVRIRARTRTSDGEYNPSSLLQVMSIEKLEPLRLVLTGTTRVIGADGDCFVLERDDGSVVELVGTLSLLVHQRHGQDDRIRIEAQDLGLSTGSCSGGPQVMVQDYELIGPTVQ